MTPKRRERLRQKLLEARKRLRTQLPGFAEPLGEMRIYALQPLHRMSTDGKNIYVDPDWLQKASPEAVDFLLAHQLAHIWLGHIHRPALYQGFRYHLACDIIANSHLRAFGWDMEQLPGVGTLYHETFFPVCEGAELTPEEAFPRVPMDPATLSPAARKRYAVDSDVCWEHGALPEQEPLLLLSPEDPDPEKVTEAIPPASDWQAGRNARFPLALSDEDEGVDTTDRAAGSRRDNSSQAEDAFLDAIEHIIRAETWSEERATPQKTAVQSEVRTRDWDAAAKETLKSVRSQRDYSRQKAERRPGEDRIWQKVNRTCLDWRRLLDSFLQEEVCDYSFLPPDRRFGDGEFFLPDFTETMLSPLKVLFMVDTSGSVDDGLLSVAYTEILSAIEQFQGSLTGLLGFFDLQAYPPRPFASVSDIRRIMPHGGGGTDFHCIFRDCRKYFGEDRLASLIILTDGQAEFPEESEAAGIPTLWLLTDEKVLPPWGRCAWLPKGDSILS